MLATSSSRSSGDMSAGSVGSGRSDIAHSFGDAHPSVVGRGDQGSVARGTPPLATGYLRDAIPKSRAKAPEANPHVNRKRRFAAKCYLLRFP
ncbi:MAG: hypothetical protein AMXMBFR58_29280 [Phycisphaerae bacterium]